MGTTDIIQYCLQSLGVDMHVKNSQLCNCHVIVIAVKPYLVAKVMEDIKKHLESHHVIVSLAAGVKLADLSKVSASIQCKATCFLSTGPASLHPQDSIYICDF